MKNISEAVSKLKPEELAQAAFLYKKTIRQRNATIPKPIPGTIRKDGTQRRFVYQSTRHESAGETHIYLDTFLNKTFEETYKKDTVTGFISKTKKYL
ncbi:hypothetical protein [Mucilaginibacter psychrotolerans]|uniref:Uncharacterized protein n=1 Tax=Mucilaginibacter psychrotolerans TaxID=1524096 RepID=A0A4Y8S720_9SPHI|nr:hypothetical protein [Mucilaginibacter psychrotolerans]TFF34411.1 hypothetical protein E2R66_22310 [Mucilaginibacter psychrotolerans]